MSDSNNITESTTSISGRTSEGRFSAGVSGNPQGRPKSEAAVLRESLAEGAPDVVRAVLTAAIAGDMQAARIVLDRLVPTLKANTQPARLQLPDEASTLDMARAILAATTSGNLPIDMASQLVSAIGTFCRIEETENLRDRITALEKVALKNKTKIP